jgi:hypothetical protein
MLEEWKPAVASSEIYDDEESKKFATVQPLSLHHDLVVNGSRGHFFIWKTSGTMWKAILDDAFMTSTK